MEIISYEDMYKNQIIDLILHIQNDEAKINLPLSEQPDLLDIRKEYIISGGEFWLAAQNNTIIGTIGLMKKNDSCGILKKFFVRKEFRGQKVGYRLYNTLIEFANGIGLRYIILDTPSVAVKSHAFYEKAGFKRITKAELPIDYQYPDRNSYLYLLDMTQREIDSTHEFERNMAEPVNGTRE